MADWGAVPDLLSGLLESYVDPKRAAEFVLNFVTSAGGLLLATTLFVYMAFLTSSSRMSAQGFNRLRSKPPGDGKAGNNWAKTRAVAPKGDDASAGNGEIAVTWLGGTELRVLEAFGDTLLPGFEIATKEARTATVEQTIAMVRSNLFQGSANTRGATENPLPPRVEAYARALALRCVEMQGRPGSDVGVSYLLAQAFEANISVEQRSGLRVLFRVLSTRLGAFLLTGRAVPFYAQSLAARHALLKRWSVSRIGKFREAFQGVKRLTCSIYFSAHPEVHQPKDNSLKMAAAAAAKIKTNPNWGDIRYDPQHHRLVREGNSSASSGGQHSAAAAPRTGLWSGAKVKVSQTARAAATAAAGAPHHRRPSSISSNSNSNSNSSNPPSPASSLPRPLSFSVTASAATATSKVLPLPRSESTGSATATYAAPSASNSGACDGATDESLRELAVDVVVVGSGAGGGCAAGALAARGLKVAVVEKGDMYGAPDFAGFSEMEAYKNLYEGQGVVATDDGAVVILAGSCVGGGTTVNWSASFRTPRHVRLEWAEKLGLTSFELGGPFDKALDAVCERLGVNTEHSHRAPGCPAPHASLRVNQHQSSLWNGAVASGRLPKAVPRNAKGCIDCGSCLHGCATGSKRSTHATWLQDGLDSGNIILVPNAKVDRVLVDAGRATGVEATVTPREGGKAFPLTVRARAVVVSGGAINTPAILLRSGLKHPMIGRHLCLHPVLVTGGLFPEDYDDQGDYRCDGRHRQGTNADEAKGAPAASTAPSTAGQQTKAKASSSTKSKHKTETDGGSATPGFCPRVPEFGRGVMMGVYVQDLMRLDNGYGCVIEAPPAHPGLMGLVLPWNDALTHRLLVGMSRETSVFLCIGRDRSSNDNRVVLGPRGDPVIKYKLGKEDSQVILQGRSEMLRMMRKAGASMLVSAHEGAPWFCPGDGEEADDRFEEYVEAIESLGTSTNEAGLFSAHQMGTCRLSANPEDGPLRESGEAWECDGLFVADASVFPTSLGINPMITVEAVAHMIADEVATRLGKEADFSAPPRSESSPLRRKFNTFGKAVKAAMSRESSSASDPDLRVALGRPAATASSKLVPGECAGGRGYGGEAGRGSGRAASWRALPQSQADGAAAGGEGSDYGVPLGDLSW